jgi:hypothetical protein
LHIISWNKHHHHKNNAHKQHTAASQSDNSNSSATGLSSSSRTYTIVNPSNSSLALVEHYRRNSNVHNFTAQCVGIFLHPPPHTTYKTITLKCTGTLPPATLESAPKILTTKTTLRASPKLRRHQDHHQTMHAGPRPPTPMGPPHLPANTNLVHLHSQCAHTTPPSVQPPPLPPPETGLQMRCLQGGHDVDCRRTSIIGRGFTQRAHCCRNMVTHNGAHDRGSDTQGRRHH